MICFFSGLELKRNPNLQQDRLLIAVIKHEMSVFSVQYGVADIQIR